MPDLLHIIQGLSHVLYLGGLAFSVLMIIITGFKYVAGGGNVSSIHQNLIWIIIGIAIIVLAASLPVIIQSFVSGGTLPSAPTGAGGGNNPPGITINPPSGTSGGGQTSSISLTLLQTSGNALTGYSVVGTISLTQAAVCAFSVSANDRTSGFGRNESFETNPNSFGPSGPGDMFSLSLPSSDFHSNDTIEVVLTGVSSGPCRIGSPSSQTINLP